MARETRRMSSGARLALALVVSIVIGSVLAVGAFAAVVYHAGSVRIEVEERAGNHVAVVLPASVVTAAVAVVPRGVIRDTGPDIERWWPVIRQASRALDRCPDATFVRVDGPDLRVRIAKQDGLVIVEIFDHGDRVHLSFPTGVVSAIVRGFERAADLRS